MLTAVWGTMEGGGSGLGVLVPFFSSARGRGLGAYSPYSGALPGSVALSPEGRRQMLILVSASPPRLAADA